MTISVLHNAVACVAIAVRAAHLASTGPLLTCCLRLYCLCVSCSSLCRCCAPTRMHGAGSSRARQLTQHLLLLGSSCPGPPLSPLRIPIGNKSALQAAPGTAAATAATAAAG
jgi:hypothetical protein